MVKNLSIVQIGKKHWCQLLNENKYMRSWTENTILIFMRFVSFNLSSFTSLLIETNILVFWWQYLLQVPFHMSTTNFFISNALNPLAKYRQWPIDLDLRESSVNEMLLSFSFVSSYSFVDNFWKFSHKMYFSNVES